MARTRDSASADTATRILDSAELLVQSRGFNGFSYADVAADVALTKASLHYHFAGKAELGLALIERYAERFGVALEEIDGRCGDAPSRLASYARIYADVLRGGRMCLCGMLAAEYETLSQPMRSAVAAFFARNETWLADALAGGRADGSLRFDGPAEDAARALIGGLEGAMLLARTGGGAGRFEVDAERLLAAIAGLPATVRTTHV